MRAYIDKNLTDIQKYIKKRKKSISKINNDCLKISFDDSLIMLIIFLSKGLVSEDLNSLRRK